MQRASRPWQSLQRAKLHKLIQGHNARRRNLPGFCMRGEAAAFAEGRDNESEA